VDKPLATPLPRLFDLVRRREPRLDVAFFFALRNTLVAPDIEAATATAYEGESARPVRRSACLPACRPACLPA
jgi:hypothetical protein